MVSLRGVILCLTLAVLLRSDLAMGQDGTSPPLPAVKHMIDTHIHLFDSSRPEGIPWPPADDKVLYKPHLPAEFSSVAKPSGVTGVVIVEASDRSSDWRFHARFPHRSSQSNDSPVPGHVTEP